MFHGQLERVAQKLALTVVNTEPALNALFAGLTEQFDMRLRNVMSD